MIHGADDTVEIHDSVEELPGNVSLESAEESVGRHDMRTGGPGDVDEVLISAEVQLPK